jgi:outer membrane protein assembly factor BamD (BamD/ComL family)
MGTSFFEQAKLPGGVMKKILGCMALCACLLAAGCGAERDWHFTVIANNLTAYQAFIQNHPDSEHVEEARGRILSLRDDQAWRDAQRGNSVESYQAYLKTYGGGLHADDARFEITALHRAAAWRALQGDLTVASLQAFLQDYPEGVESNEARQRLDALQSRAQTAGGPKVARDRR